MGWWEVVCQYPRSLTPWGLCALCIVSRDSALAVHAGNGLLVNPMLISPHFPTLYWGFLHLSNKLLASLLKSLSQGPRRAQTKAEVLVAQFQCKLRFYPQEVSHGNFVNTLGGTWVAETIRACLGQRGDEAWKRVSEWLWGSRVRIRKGCLLGQQE